METKFNFTSKPCTSKEQSKRLLSLGLKKETADMSYTAIVVNHKVDYRLDCSTPKNIDIPAWSLHRLLCFLPKHIRVYDEVWKFKRILYLSIDEDFNIRYEENIDEPCFDKIFWEYNIYQNCIDCIEWLIKEGHFNKEYWEE